MNTIRVTKQFNFEMAHALFEYDGPCKNLHGHSYYLEVCIRGQLKNNEENQGMVIDFSELKNNVKPFVDELDHATMLYKKSIDNQLIKNTTLLEKLIIVDFQPTCENILIDLATKIKANIPTHIQLYRLMLRETPTSFAEWFAEDN
jgi:6-pyruvoyltetrahydropterin/6-carboxytetrahydropterin synthase